MSVMVLQCRNYEKTEKPYGFQIETAEGVTNEEWLDFVADNRSGNYDGALYDVVYGPVADDDVYTTFTLYQAGALTKEQTLETLKIKKLYDQMVFTSEKALSFVKFVGTIPEEDM